MNEMKLIDVCERLVQIARKEGAAETEAYAERTRDSSVRVRDGAVEELHQAASKGVGLRVIHNQRLGFAYGTDFSREGLTRLAQQALALAKGAARDEANGLPRGKLLGSGGEGQYDHAIEQISPEWKLQAARSPERGAKAEDARIRKFDSTGAGDFLAHAAIASSRGAHGESKASYAYVYCSPVAEQDGQLQTASWSDTRRRLVTLQDPEYVGRTAARRAARMLGAKKAATQRVPVVFDPRMAAGFIGGLADAVNGLLVHKKSSFFCGLKGKRIAPKGFTLLDDATLPMGIATRPFDGEGVTSQTTPIVEDGVLRNFLYDATTARKAKSKTTGSASRGWASLPSIGTSNFYLKPGTRKPDEIVKEMKNGFYVTAMLGRGADVVTGDYSRGANGIWIENGELAWPVQEVTVSGNLLEMLKGIDAIGDDLDFRSSTAAPTLRFAELQVSGA
ncbi:MAG TPA: TldD/PmbA family protein [Myxococcales bacterium]|nr:TldD/PmbA family protein [Myxococcales bacterium]